MNIYNLSLLSLLLMISSLLPMDKRTTRSAKEQSDLNEKLALVLRSAKGDKKKEQLKEAKRLLGQGADVNGEVIDNAHSLGFANTSTQLQRAIGRYSFAAPWLLRHGANPNKITDVNHCPPIFLALEKVPENFQLLKSLVRAGADLTQMYQGYTPIMKAVLSVDIAWDTRDEMIKLLLQARSSTLKNQLHALCASRKKNNYFQLLPADLINYLPKFAGVDISVKNYEGKTVLDLLLEQKEKYSDRPLTWIVVNHAILTLLKRAQEGSLC